MEITRRAHRPDRRIRLISQHPPIPFWKPRFRKRPLFARSYHHEPRNLPQKRRKAAGVDLRTVAHLLAALPMAVRPITPAELARLTDRLEAAEADTDNITVEQAMLLQNAFTFDIEVYEQLLLLHHCPWGSGLPVPQVCRECACSWHDPCLTPGRDGVKSPCGWTESDLCTVCAPQGPPPGKVTLCAGTPQPELQGAAA